MENEIYEEQATPAKKNFWETAANVWGLRFFLNSKNGLGVALKVLLLFVIPYAYIWLCGFLFEGILNWMDSATFVFFSACALLAIGILIAVWAIVRAIRKSKKADRKE